MVSMGVAGLFDRVSNTYDRVGVQMFGPIAELLLASVAPTEGERLLDVGCGRGAVLLRAARLVGPGGAAVGLDLSPAMVGAAREEAGAAGLHVEVQVGDAMRPALLPRSYDVVTSSLVLFFLPDPAGALSAWRELLRPGGRVGVTTFGAAGSAWDQVDRTVMGHAPAAARDPRVLDPDGPFASDAGVEGLFAGGGFTDIRSDVSVVPVRFEDEEQWYRWSWSIGQRVTWERLDEPDRERVRAEAFERLQDTRDAQGRIGFDQEVRVTLARR